MLPRDESTVYSTSQLRPICREQVPAKGVKWTLSSVVRRACFARGLEDHMRVLLGMILGAALTVAVAYYSDSMRTSSVAAGPAATENKPMVNWDVVQLNWNIVKQRAQAGWADLRARVDRS
jgi:hypothetical protein